MRRCWACEPRLNSNAAMTLSPLGT
jgi:hypothetical protein